jgi:hypothetical protein
MRDDGAVVYLNGVEALRSNMPGGDFDYRTAAASSVSGAEETAWFTNRINPALLVEGANVMAVEVHQAGSSGSDLVFDLELSGQRRSSPVSPAVLKLNRAGRDLVLSWPAAEGWNLYGCAALVGDVDAGAGHAGLEQREKRSHGNADAARPLLSVAPSLIRVRPGGAPVAAGV